MTVSEYSACLADERHTGNANEDSSRLSVEKRRRIDELSRHSLAVERPCV
jgi:hypothetical protein